MSFTNRKIKKFDIPDGIQSIVVEDEPDQEYSNEDHEPKSENPIKTEPEDDPRLDKDMDINEYMGSENADDPETDFDMKQRIYDLKVQLGVATPMDEMNMVMLQNRVKRHQKSHPGHDSVTHQDAHIMEWDTYASRKSDGKTRKRIASGEVLDRENGIVPSSSRSRKRHKLTGSGNNAGRVHVPVPVDPTGPTRFWKDVDHVAEMATEQEIEQATRKDLLSGLIKNAPLGTPAQNAQVKRDTKRLEIAMQSFSSKAGHTKTNRAINAKTGGFLVEGMVTPLKAHQVISAGRMRAVETGDSVCRGGICSDAPGLGKTVTSIANIVNGRPLKAQLNASSRHTTLVVCSPGPLGAQWRSEITKHSKRETSRNNWGIGNVLEFSDAIKDPDDLHLYDIVVCTYHQLQTSWPSCKFPTGTLESEKHSYIWENHYKDIGYLHKFGFLRVVIDEAHRLKNPKTLVAQASFNLDATFKWALTGTPMINGTKDLYSLFRFIGLPIACEMTYAEFKKQFCWGKKNDTVDHLPKEMIDSIQGFTQTDTLFNAKLFTIPTPKNSSFIVQPTKIEKSLYDIIDDRFVTIIKASKSKRSNAVTKMNLLRQLTSHPMIAVTTAGPWLEKEDFDKFEKVVKEEQKSGIDGISMIHALRDLMSQTRKETEQKLLDGIKPGDLEFPDDISDRTEGPGGVEHIIQSENIATNLEPLGTGLAHGKNIDNSAFMNNLQNATQKVDSEKSKLCCKCNNPASDPRITLCGHLYCLSHLRDRIDKARRKNRDHATCRVEHCGKKIKLDILTNPTTEQPLPWLDGEGKLLPSAKTLAAKSQILDWLMQDDTAKIIIFCQWKKFLAILSTMCEEEKWGYTTLHGSLNKKTRDVNIEKFKTDPETRILIATLQTGSEGLNLTCARYVLNTDPYWNTAGEEQAFCRVYRMGQKEDTEFVNLTLAGSIDTKINGIKFRKDNEIQNVHEYCKKMSNADLLELLES
ncbi:hypothetical protein M438DRAFT_405755 [Aureobasidium pullulans EXF-150]|uniref:Helicase C-terminal domain-containing protein n=1 Tax=Aureobasidium pullulans EXF-150 TaxID=1043002 RepID=A0A074XGJ5_AURPU|nr:uncharacterized protein M438DRAFT_405755 [Aureobasidium pullulans EXF-150]KEQ84558.1 hypothetical protein M438DRAFT_405755 [Aureobasidium pullulans EXF-150]